jgi:hypothetical protein
MRQKNRNVISGVTDNAGIEDNSLYNMDLLDMGFKPNGTSFF